MRPLHHLRRLLASSGKLSASLFTLLTVSCSTGPPQLSEGELRAAPDPPELALLEPFVGVWDGITTSTLVETGETFESRSIRRVQWESGGQFLVERSATRIGEGPPATSVTIWTWDDQGNVYRAWRFDSQGTVHERTMTWNDEQQVWLLEMISRHRGESEPSLARGNMRFTSEDERMYEWTRFHPGTDTPWVEIHGSSTRVPHKN